MISNWTQQQQQDLHYFCLSNFHSSNFYWVFFSIFALYPFFLLFELNFTIFLSKHKNYFQSFLLGGRKQDSKIFGETQHSWTSYMRHITFVFLPTTSLELRNNTHTLNSKTSSYVQSLELDGSNQLLTTHQELFLKFL